THTHTHNTQYHPPADLTSLCVCPIRECVDQSDLSLYLTLSCQGDFFKHSPLNTVGYSVFEPKSQFHTPHILRTRTHTRTRTRTRTHTHARTHTHTLTGSIMAL